MSASNSSPKHFFGIDIAKKDMAVACYGRSEVNTVANHSAEIARWLATLPEGACVGVESTGRLHLRLLEACHERGITAYVLNPRSLRSYARATGRGAKTDRLDALLLARYLAHEHEHLHPWQPAPEALGQIGALLKLRDTVVAAASAVRQSAAALGQPSEEMQQFLAAASRASTQLLRQARTLACSQPAWKALVRRLRFVPGFGPLNTLMLLLALERHRLRHIGAFVAMTGLDPRPCDSGQKRGRRRLSKAGNALLRKLLFNAAMAAVRHSLFAPIYAKLLERGLSRTEALVVIARKLARIAWAIYKTGKDFDPSKFTSPHCKTT